MENLIKKEAEHYVFTHPRNAAINLIDAVTHEFNRCHASSKLKDVEIMELKNKNEFLTDACNGFKTENKALEEKLKVAVEALAKIHDNDCTMFDMDRTAYQALEKIKGTK